VTADRTSISSLIEKRRELARLIETLEEQLDQHWTDLAHIDGALRLLGKELDPETLRPKGRYRRSPHFGPTTSCRGWFSAFSAPRPASRSASRRLRGG
jgi:hypothetical protein